jgi:hypothetical protein
MFMRCFPEPITTRHSRIRAGKGPGDHQPAAPARRRARNHPTRTGVGHRLVFMAAFLPFLMVAGGLAAIMGFFTWLASLARRRGVAGTAIRAAMAAHDEAFRVTAYDSHHEIQAQAERKTPMVSPDDPWRPSRGAAGRPGAAGRRPPRPHPRRPWQGLRRRVRRLRHRR